MSRAGRTGQVSTPDPMACTSSPTRTRRRVATPQPGPDPGTRDTGFAEPITRRHDILWQNRGNGPHGPGFPPANKAAPELPTSC